MFYFLREPGEKNREGKSEQRRKKQSRSEKMNCICEEGAGGKGNIPWPKDL